MNMKSLPTLPLDEWERTKDTLHLFLQIVGKIRLALFPEVNHLWHVPLYLSARGLTTRPIPAQGKIFEIEFDLLAHQLHVRCSNGSEQNFALSGLSVADFYQQLMQVLQQMEVQVSIKAQPYDVPFSNIPFAEDTTHATYQTEWVEKYWQTLIFVNTVFEIFRGRFIGKSTPVHLFWHHADLVLTRFSGNTAPKLEGGTKVEQAAYSHEVISFGFWVGDDTMREPAFYAYSHPQPKNIEQTELLPAAANWADKYGYSMALLKYEDVRTADDPQQQLLTFLQSAYDNFSQQAGWKVSELVGAGG